MAYTTNAYINANNFTEGSYMACAVKITASRASGTSKKVTITCDSYLGFGSYADYRSQEGGTIYADLWYGGETWATRTGGSYATVSTGDWAYNDGGTWSRLTTSDSNLTQYAYTPHKHNTFSFTISDWTSSSKYFYYDVEGPYSHTVQRVSLACPTYYTNATVTMSTQTQTVNPDETIRIQWTATSGTNNAITGYTLYYNGTAYDCKTNKYKDLPVPPANKTYEVYVKASAPHNTPTTSTIKITTRDYGVPTATLSTTSQTLKPDTLLTVNWSGEAGLSNPVSKYQLYYNGTKVYEGMSTSYQIEAPPVDTSYIVYVNAVGTNGGKVGKSEEININTTPYMWVMLYGLWKSVQSVYIYINGEWKNVDASAPIGVAIENQWKSV